MGKRKITNPEVRALVDQAIEHGCQLLGYDGRGHPRLLLPNGRKTSIPSSPSDWRSLRNVRSRLRRYGVPLS